MGSFTGVRITFREGEKDPKKYLFYPLGPTYAARNEEERNSIRPVSNEEFNWRRVYVARWLRRRRRDYKHHVVVPGRSWTWDTSNDGIDYAFHYGALFLEESSDA